MTCHALTPRSPAHARAGLLDLPCGRHAAHRTPDGAMCGAHARQLGRANARASFHGNCAAAYQAARDIGGPFFAGFVEALDRQLDGR